MSCRRSPTLTLSLTPSLSLTLSLIDALQALCARCDETGVQFISDELYHGIVYLTLTLTLP